jgi:PTH2 family peptidyl-tRNA hydrolase
MIKQVILMRTDLSMNRGKIAAQAAHAAMLFILDTDLGFSDVEMEWLYGETQISGWDFGGMTKIVLAVNSREELLKIHDAAKAASLRAYVVIDKTLKVETCCAIGPDDANKINAITGHLSLLN